MVTRHLQQIGMQDKKKCTTEDKELTRGAAHRELTQFSREDASGRSILQALDSQGDLFFPHACGLGSCLI